MYRLRRHLNLLSRIMLAAMLFAQFAHAAQPCPMSEKTPAMAFDEAAAPCMGSANACLADCTRFDQSASHAELPSLAAPVVAVLTLSASPPAAGSIADNTDFASSGSGPPAPIPLSIPLRFCSFLI